ncbi:MAG: methyltransferase, partial [Sedimenticolaceae bacterium]
MATLDQTTRNYLRKLRQDIVFSETTRDQHLTYHTTWGLFSPKNLDHGSLLLLDYLQINEDDDTLDLGCGYGPLGLTMARLAPKGNSLLIDKDFVAVDYSRKNAELNNIKNAEVILSN